MERKEEYTERVEKKERERSSEIERNRKREC